MAPKTNTDALAAKAARLAAPRSAPATTAAPAAPGLGREERVRTTLDLPLETHEAVQDMIRRLQRELGARRVSGQKIILASVQAALTDPATYAHVREGVRAQLDAEAQRRA